MSGSEKKILFQLTGSIAAYKACFVISRLVQDGREVQTACTRRALEFIGPATLEGLTGRKPFVDPFERGEMLSHISWTRWADLAIVCPATANTINRLAAGLADDLIGSMFLARDPGKPYLVAPAMNHAMYENPATQASLARLASWGVAVLPTETGRQACGETGPGRLLDPEKILERIRAALQ
jgi:phosphopantothenoylcysteine decarboxylase/phosphopantothenate--cysteine ligase